MSISYLGNCLLKLMTNPYCHYSNSSFELPCLKNSELVNIGPTRYEYIVYITIHNNIPTHIILQHFLSNFLSRLVISSFFYSLSAYPPFPPLFPFSLSLLSYSYYCLVNHLHNERIPLTVTHTTQAKCT